MKRTFGCLLLCLLVFVSLLATVRAAPSPPAQTAAPPQRFWVGGTGSWSSTLHWSATTGGATGASVPDSTTDVFFDGNSGLGTATLDVNAYSHDVTGTAMSLTAVALGAQTWTVTGNVTDMMGAKIGQGTSTLNLAGNSTQTINPRTSGVNFNAYNILISGTGDKVVNVRLFAQGATVHATVSATMRFFPDSAGTTAAFYCIPKTVYADAGSTLTMVSTSPGSKWRFDTQGARVSLQGVALQDASAVVTISGVSLPLNAHDTTNTDLGGNANVGFTAFSSMVDGALAGTTITDYGPQQFENSLGNYVVVYPDGTSTSNGALYAKYSTDGGRTWSSRVTLMSASGGILDATVGAGWEVYGVVDRNDVLHLVGHKLIGGAIHTYYTQLNMANVANAADFQRWTGIAGVPPASQGTATNGHGYDDLGANADPSIALRSDLSMAVFMVPTAGGAATIRIGSNGAWSAAGTWTYGGTNPTINPMIVVAGADDTLYAFAQLTQFSNANIVATVCSKTSDCSKGFSWTTAAGPAGFDYVISSGSGGFGFPKVTVSAGGNVVVTAGSGFLVGGFNRAFYNVLVPGAGWKLGTTLNGSGQEVNSALSWPSRTELKDNVRGYFMGADTQGTSYLIWTDFGVQYDLSLAFYDSNLSWSAAYSALLPAAAQITGPFHVRNGETRLNFLAYQGGATGPGLQGLTFAGIVVTPGNAWWDNPVNTPPPNHGGAPAWSLSCAYNQLLITWTCHDATDYSLFYVSSVRWVYDGVIVANATPNADVSFRAPNQGWLNLSSESHVLVVQPWGGTQTPTQLALQTSEWQAWVLVLALFVLVLVASLRQIAGATEANTYYMAVANPSYRRTAISVDEYPKGWRSYRQHDPDRYVRLRSESRAARRAHPNRWTIYGIRAASAAEQERTGKKYVAEVQTVRERM